MATAPTPGQIYLIESDGTDNDDWITDHGGDPDLLDLGLFTEGTDYVTCKIPIMWNKKFWIGAQITDSGGGKTYDLRWNRRGYLITFHGIETSRVNADLIEQFIMSDRHTVGSTATFKRYHLIIYHGVNDHVQFTDASGNRKGYMTCLATLGNELWREEDNPTVRTRLNIRSVWG